VHVAKSSTRLGHRIQGFPREARTADVCILPKQTEQPRPAIEADQQQRDPPQATADRQPTTSRGIASQFDAPRRNEREQRRDRPAEEDLSIAALRRKYVDVVAHLHEVSPLRPGIGAPARHPLLRGARPGMLTWQHKSTILQA